MVCSVEQVHTLRHRHRRDRFAPDSSEYNQFEFHIRWWEEPFSEGFRTHLISDETQMKRRWPSGKPLQAELTLTSS